MNFHLKQRATSDHARFVGEAAGFQDYLFGLGIRYALTSGNLAARSILEGRDFDNLWRAELGAKRADYGRQLKLYGQALQRIYRRPVTALWLHFLALKKTVPLGSETD